MKSNASPPTVSAVTDRPKTLIPGNIGADSGLRPFKISRAISMSRSRRDWRINCSCSSARSRTIVAQLGGHRPDLAVVERHWSGRRGRSVTHFDPPRVFQPRGAEVHFGLGAVLIPDDDFAKSCCENSAARAAAARPALPSGGGDGLLLGAPRPAHGPDRRDLGGRHARRAACPELAAPELRSRGRRR